MNGTRTVTRCSSSRRRWKRWAMRSSRTWLEGPAGPHVLCREIDTGGALIEMTLDVPDRRGQAFELELMVPASMVRMIVSAHSDGSFGFGPRKVAPAAGNCTGRLIVQAAIVTYRTWPLC